MIVRKQISFIEVQLLYQLLGLAVKVLVLTQLESLVVELAYVFAQHEFHQVVLQHLELEVYRPVIIGENRNSVLKLVRVGVSRVVYQEHALEVSINDPEVLDVHAFWTQVAMLPEQSVMHVLPIRIQVVDHLVRVARVARCKHNHLEELA